MAVQATDTSETGSLVPLLKWKRLFGAIAAGGTVGAVTGPVLMTSLAISLGPAHIVSANIHDLAQRTAMFPQMDFSVNTLAFFIQISMTGRLVERSGIA